MAFYIFIMELEIIVGKSTSHNVVLTWLLRNREEMDNPEKKGRFLNYVQKARSTRGSGRGSK